jgi:hypothetical protein
MDEPISAADANRRFSLLLRGVREGPSEELYEDDR